MNPDLIIATLMFVVAGFICVWGFWRDYSERSRP